MRGKFEFQNIGFQYGPNDPPILKQISASIEAGEYVAIVGPSGCGKSTLLKVICGLYPAGAGRVLIDGLALSTWGPRQIRKSIGVVMQDDELLPGSIAENVAFFSDAIDIDWVWQCLKSAAIDDEVRAMPMRADTLIGEMGSSLSGGQKQRILLARALYKRPQVLILDEATSHLDLARERQINTALKALSITRIVVAHRPETIASADRVLQLGDGLVELPPIGALGSIDT